MHNVKRSHKTTMSSTQSVRLYEQQTSVRQAVPLRRDWPRGLTLLLLNGFGATRLPTRPAKRRKAPEGHETVLRNAPTHFQEPAHKNVNVDSPSLGFPYFNFLGGDRWKKNTL